MDAFPPQLFQARADRREIIGSAGRGHAPPHLLPMDFDFCRAADWLIIGARTSGARSDRGIPEWCVLHRTSAHPGSIKAPKKAERGPKCPNLNRVG